MALSELTKKIGKLGIVGLAGYGVYHSLKNDASEQKRSQNPKKKIKLYPPRDPKKEDLWKEWNRLVNRTAFEMRAFLASSEGKKAGLSAKKAKKAGLKRGADSARALIEMIPKGRSYLSARRNWSESEWRWAKRQVAFIKRMKGSRGPLIRDGEKTRKYLALLLWGHDPKRSV